MGVKLDYDKLLKVQKKYPKGMTAKEIRRELDSENSPTQCVGEMKRSGKIRVIVLGSLPANGLSRPEKLYRLEKT